MGISLWVSMLGVFLGGTCLPFFLLLVPGVKDAAVGDHGMGLDPRDDHRHGFRHAASQGKVRLGDLLSAAIHGFLETSCIGR